MAALLINIDVPELEPAIALHARVRLAARPSDGHGVCLLQLKPRGYDAIAT